MTTAEETNQQVYIRVGHHYVKTIGCHGVLGGRSFECPVDTAFNSNGLIYVAGRAETTPRVTIIDIDENFHGEFGLAATGSCAGPVASRSTATTGCTSPSSTRRR